MRAIARLLCLSLYLAAAQVAAAAVTDVPEADRIPTAGTASTAPALAIGLNGISDWTTQHPFIDVFKTSRPWIGHLPGQWGGLPAEALRAGGHLDASGWPVSLPPEAERLEALILTDQQEEARHLRGYYTLTYAGQGEITLTGRAKRVDRGPGRLRFFYEPGPGAVGVSISTLDPNDPIRDIAVVRDAHLALHAAGALFNPDWLRRISGVRTLRFMDWMATNGSPVRSWEDRPRLGDATYAAWGVPLPVMLRLANEIGADPWFTLPHMADDAYVRRFAEAVRDGLDPRLKAHVEYSNEVWNDIFAQSGWADARAEALWGKSADGRMQFYGLRAAQVMDIWSGVFGAEAGRRLVRVFATHTGWAGREAQALAAPLAFLSLGRMPRESFDAYAVTGYLYHEPTGANARALEGWLDAAEDAAARDGAAQGLARVALREHVRAHRFDAAFAPFAEQLAASAVRPLVEEVFPYHAEAAARAGLDLIMYEGGAHLAATGSDLDEDRLAAFLSAFAYSQEMAGLYDALMTGWSAAGGRLFNAFVDVAKPSKWGAWGALRHLGDTNPRWDSLMAYNAAAPLPDRRPGAVFADGALAAGTQEADEIRGSSEEDVILSGAGDDLLISGGGADILHGGPGRDRAVLPGARADYTIATDAAGRTEARAGWRVVRLTEIEELSFERDPETILPLR